MFEYDATLKTLLKGSAARTLQEISGLAITHWRDVELPSVALRVDLLGESGDGRLLHIELQSTNERSMPQRMLEYGVAVMRRHGRYPKQVVLYVGEPPLRMPSEFRANEDFVFRCKNVDIREVDGKLLLDSDGIEDNVLAILARLGDQREAVRRIVGRTANLDESRRHSTLEHLSVLAGLRHLGRLVEEETRRMPITEDILNHDLIGPAYRRGQQEGRDEGRQEGELTLLRRQLVKRFGPIPTWIEERLARCSAGDLLEISDRVLDAQSLDDILR